MRMNTCSPTDILLGKGALKRHTRKGTQDLEPRTLTRDLIPGTHKWGPICGTLFMEQIRGTNVRQLIFLSEFLFFCIVLFLMYNLEVS